MGINGGTRKNRKHSSRIDNIIIISNAKNKTALQKQKQKYYWTDKQAIVTTTHHAPDKTKCNKVYCFAQQNTPWTLLCAKWYKCCKSQWCCQYMPAWLVLGLTCLVNSTSTHLLWYRKYRTDNHSAKLCFLIFIVTFNLNIASQCSYMTVMMTMYHKLSLAAKRAAL